MVMLRASESAEQKEDWKKASAKTKNITQTSKASLASFELGLDGLCVWNSCGAHQTLKLFLNTKIQSLAPALRKLGVFIWDDADRRTSLHGWKCHPLQKAEKADWDLVFWSGTIPWTTRACGLALRENGRFSSICYGFLIVYAMYACLAEKCIPGPCWLKAGCWSCINAFEAFKSIPVRWHLASICIEPLRSLLDQMLFLVSLSFNSNSKRKSQSHDWTLEPARWKMILNQHVLHQPGLPM